MKPFVYKEIGPPMLVVLLTVAVVAATGASAGATYLIASGFLAIALAIRLGPERMQLRREERDRAGE